MPNQQAIVLYICYKNNILDNALKLLGNAFHKIGPVIFTVNLEGQLEQLEQHCR